MTKRPTHYDTLGVPADAGSTEIRAGYRAAIARSHPDVNLDPGATATTMGLAEAWQVLRDPISRAIYDASIGVLVGPMGQPSGTELDLIGCERCHTIAPSLRFVTIVTLTFRGAEETSATLCENCRSLQTRRANLVSALAGRWRSGGPEAVRATIARNASASALEPFSNSLLLRHLGLAFAQRERFSDAAAALEASLEFQASERVEEILAAVRPFQPPATIDARPAATPPPRRLGRHRLAFAGLAALAVVAFVATAPLRAVRANAFATRVATLAESSREAVLKRDGSPLFLFDLASDPAFSRAYAGALAGLPASAQVAQPWLATLETTSIPAELVRTTNGGTYIIASGCKPHDCVRERLALAYDRDRNAVAGVAYYDGTRHFFGSRSLDDRALVALADALDRLNIGDPLPLHGSSATRVERFVAQN